MQTAASCEVCVCVRAVLIKRINRGGGIILTSTYRFKLMHTLYSIQFTAVLYLQRAGAGLIACSNSFAQILVPFFALLGLVSVSNANAHVVSR